MAPILYMSSLSPPSRAVLITAQALNIELELRSLDLSKGEHRAPEYVKLNPLHSVPTIVDNGTVIADSHAINAYLVRKYAPEDSLYPKDFAKRALVDQRLHFDTGILFELFRNTVAPLFYRKSKVVSQELKNRVLDGIADISIGSTVLALNLLVPLEPSAYPKTDAWIKRFQSLGYAKVNEPGLRELKEVIEKCMA